jgi:hypothetical protein
LPHNICNSAWIFSGPSQVIEVKLEKPGKFRNISTTSTYS